MFQKSLSKYIFLIAITFFLLSAIVGLLVRWNFVSPSHLVSYINLVQGHSHVAFLGWGYLGVIGVILKLFISKENRDKLIYKITLLIIVVSIFLMLFSFSLSGYKMFSIILLSIFGITSYVLSFSFLKDLTGSNTSIKFIKYSIYYYLLSSLATWFLVLVIIKFGKSDLYYNTIYFYLHFLYNGFFVFSLFGILLKILENQQILISEIYKRLFFIYLNIACIPAYFLSILWSKVGPLFYIIGFAASILQFISLIFLVKIIQQAFLNLKWSQISKVLLKFLVIAYSLKVVSQIGSSFPYFVDNSLALKPYFIIGYLHLFTLAFMSVFIILILSLLEKIYFKNKISILGLIFFLIGILLTELLLFGQGFLILAKLKPIKEYNMLLFLCSSFMVTGILFLFIGQISKSRNLLQ